MHITDNTIHFTSIEEMYNKEICGLKPNTVRIFTDEELKTVLESSYTHIQIKKVGSDHYFTRYITDISYLHDIKHDVLICIFSW